jgi:hypothetical protein
MASLALLLPRLDMLLPEGRGELTPALSTLVARGSEPPAHEPGLVGALSGLFTVHPPQLAAAALTRRLDAPGDTAGVWLRADPVHVRADLGVVRMLAHGNLGLSADESADLARGLRPIFGDEGLELSVPHPERWYLKLPREARLPAFAPPPQVLGDDMHPYLPEGDLGKRWRRLLNETQIVLHNHPVNAQRVAHGHPAANSLWFWGGGTLPDWVRTSCAALMSDDPAMTGLALLAQVRQVPLGSAVDALALGERALIDLAGQRRVDLLESAWLEPMQRALRSKRLRQLELRFLDGQQRRIAPGDLWRFWRR